MNSFQIRTRGRAEMNEEQAPWLEIRPLKNHGTCGGSPHDETGECTTYKDHPDWKKLKRMHNKDIPSGEMALVVRMGNTGGLVTGFCFCHKHAMEFLEFANDLRQQAKELGWKAE